MDPKIQGDPSFETLEPVREGTTLRAGLVFATRYLLEARVGSGGSGALFRAFDTVLHRPVALKILHARRDEPMPARSASRLLREARTAAALNHPNIVAIYDVGEHKGVPFIAMEYVEGKSLRAFVGKSEPGIETRTKWVIDIARALAAAHKKGIVHRDIKPDNVMLHDDGTVKVLDFGIARLMAEHRHEQPIGKSSEVSQRDGNPSGMAHAHTDSTTSYSVQEGDLPLIRIVGTPGYIAPEQIRGATADARADQFGWAVTAYELFSGRRPWSGNRHSLMMSVLTDEASPLTGVPEGIAHAIGRALQTKPERRYASMGELLAALSTGSATPPPPAAPGPRMRRLSPRHRTMAILGAVVCVAMSAGVLRTRFTYSSPSAPRPAPSQASSPMPIGTAVTEVPISPKCNNDAKAAYREGLLATQGASWELAYASFKKASEADPTCPEAQLQLSMIGYALVSIDQVRTQFHQTLALQGELDDRGRALVDAFAPLILYEKADYQEWSRRLDNVASVFPFDAQILGRAASALMHTAKDTSTVEHALDLVARATRIDPKYADAWQVQARALVYLGKTDEALKSLAECIHIAPGSPDCVSERIRTRRPSGQCELVAADARRWIANDPSTFYGYIELANALASTGAPAETIDAALRQARAGTSHPGDMHESLYLYHRSLLLALHGDFADSKKGCRAITSKRARRLGALRPRPCNGIHGGAIH